MYRSILISIIAILAGFASVQAQERETGSDTVVSLVVFDPGADIYELEGHAALRVQIPSDGTDVAISYGTFDFNAPNFVYRFVKGETDYWVSEIPWHAFAQAYARQGRTITEHVLDLTPRQTDMLIALIAENLRPENATYRYNYVKDNCATRPLAIVEKALGDTVALPAPSIDADVSTFRKAMMHYHRNYPWYQFGIDLALGSGIDYTITPRQMAFAPALLNMQLADATVGGRKLVKSTAVIYQGTDATLPPTSWYLSPATVCWLLLAAIAAVSVRDWRRRRLTRWIDTALFTVYGLAGCLLTFLIFVSVHEATSPNWLYLWLNPLCLLVPALMWTSHRTMLARYQILNLALIAAMVLIWPFAGQRMNPAFIPLILADAMRSAEYIMIEKKNRTTPLK